MAGQHVPIDYFARDPAMQNTVRAAAQNYRPFPNFGDVRFRSNFGHSTYHGGTVKLEKRYSDGLFFSTFYTFSKAITEELSVQREMAGTTALGYAERVQNL